MTWPEALKEARRRWGTTGGVDRVAGRYCVGCNFKAVTVEPLILGRGPSWEAAFADADRREAETRKQS